MIRIMWCSSRPDSAEGPTVPSSLRRRADGLRATGEIRSLACASIAGTTSTLPMQTAAWGSGTGRMP
ncbi:hypothetical protein A6A28_02245 [Streptomyces sp. CB03578]|nr:hypothetical protein A6A28_02245 [Streptomyces sp. CB03578]